MEGRLLLMEERRLLERLLEESDALGRTLLEERLTIDDVLRRWCEGGGLLVLPCREEEGIERRRGARRLVMVGQRGGSKARDY